MFLMRLCIYSARVEFDVSSYHKSTTKHVRSYKQLHLCIIRKNDVNRNKYHLTIIVAFLMVQFVYVYLCVRLFVFSCWNI